MQYTYLFQEYMYYIKAVIGYFFISMSMTGMRLCYTCTCATKKLKLRTAGSINKKDQKHQIK